MDYDATHNPNKRCKTVPSSSYNEATNTLPTSSRQQTNEVETGVRGGEQETGAVRSPFGEELINGFETFSSAGLDWIQEAVDAQNFQDQNEVRDARMVGTEVQSTEQEMVEREEEESREMLQEYFMQLNETGVPGGGRNKLTYTVLTSSQEQTNEGEIEVRDVGMAQTEMGEGVEQENWNESMIDDSMKPVDGDLVGEAVSKPWDGIISFLMEDQTLSNDSEFQGKTVPSSSYNEAINTLPTSSRQQTNEVETGVRGGEQETGAVRYPFVNNNNNNNNNSINIQFHFLHNSKLMKGTGVPRGSRNELTYTVLTSSQEQTNEGEIEGRDAGMAQTETGEGVEQENWKESRTDNSMQPVGGDLVGQAVSNPWDIIAFLMVDQTLRNDRDNVGVSLPTNESREMPQESFMQLNETGVPRGSRNEASDCVAELMEKSKFEGGFVIHAPPPAVELLQLPRVMEKASVERTLQKILKCIANERFHTIGIWGMGGAGKTTVMKALNNLPEISKAFDIVIWVTVSSQGSVEMVQKRVAERLSLSLRNEESIESRASKISQTLNSKRFLLLLDDVWEMIDLDTVGIPNQENGSQVVLTTRSQTVCNEMETDANVKVDVLSEEEAWNLFSTKVGEVVNSENITEFAKVVVKECDGLPLAIIVLGAALRNTDDVHVWRNALRELQSQTSFTIKGMEDRVFKPLKFSYDHLRDDNMKQCFLYCALYPEDHEIKDAELIEYWRAEGLTGDVRTVEAAYDKGRAILNILVQSSLLEKRGDKNYVMHDVIRDLALRITSPVKETNWDDNNAKFLVRAGLRDQLAPVKEEWEQMKRISLMHNALNSLPKAPNCPMLSTLLLQNNWNLKSIPNMFFKDMEGLRVLDLSFTSITSLPSSIGSLVSLRGLYLNECEKLLVLPPEVGCLKKLESLQICCSGIQLLPVEIGNLSNLVCLLLASPSIYLVIKSGVISKLSNLEHLVIDVDMIYDWQVDNIDDIIAEVASLRKLTKIWLHFPNDQQLKRFISSSLPWKKQSISTFHFSVGSREIFTRFDFIMPCGSTLEYIGRECSTIPHVIIDVLSHSQNFVVLNDYVMKRLSEYGLKILKGLKKCQIYGCNSIEILANEELVEEDVLPNVEDLRLFHLPNLRNIVEGHVSPRSFGNLKELELRWCDNLKYIFSWSMIKQLSKLETLHIHYGLQLEDIFEREKEVVEEDSSQLPNLKILRLKSVPKLVNIDRIATLALSSIEEIIFEGTVGLKSLPISLLSAPKLRLIEGYRRWWDEELEWENNAIKQQFQPFFKGGY